MSLLNGKHPVKNFPTKSSTDSQPEGRKLSPLINLRRRLSKSPRKELAKNAYADFATVDTETDNDTPTYSLSVSVPLSDADLIMVDLPVEESLPASLPLTSFIAPESHSPNYTLSKRVLEIESGSERDNALSRSNTDVSNGHEQDQPLQESDDGLEGETSAVRTGSTFVPKLTGLAVFAEQNQKSSIERTDLPPGLSLFESGEHDPGGNH